MDFYCNLDHTAYKAAEKAMCEFGETVHTSVEGFYHKSIRIPLGDATLEITGPAVKASPAGPKAWLDRRKDFAERRIRTRKEGEPARRLGGIQERRKKK